MSTTAERERCYWCDATFFVKFLQRDHLVPRCLGGPDEDWNLVRSCGFCNQSKGRDWPSLFAARRLKENIESFRGTRNFSRSYSDYFGWEWNERDDWNAFVRDRIAESVAVEGTFRVWAAQTRNVKALSAIGVPAMPVLVLPQDEVAKEISRLRSQCSALQAELTKTRLRLDRCHGRTFQAFWWNSVALEAGE